VLTAELVAGVDEPGVPEPDDLDLEECMAVARRYLGPLVGAFTGWTPLLWRA